MPDSQDKKLPPVPDQADDGRVCLYNEGSAPHPFAHLTHSISLDATINPPDYGDGDRTREDRDRHKERIRDQIRDRLPEVIGSNPVFGDGGKIKVPVNGGYEPRFRYGRDQAGGGGQGGEPGSDEGELIYVDLTKEELIQMLFEEMELPDLLKKQLSLTKTKGYKYRGTQPTGPKPRLKKGDTAIARIRRAIGIRNSHPEQFEEELEAIEADEHSKRRQAQYIPTPEEVPFSKRDLRYHRVEETLDDDSKAVVFFLLDRSASMDGDPLAIAKAYFLLNLLFLRARYKDVRVVMIAHDSRAYRIEEEEKFYQIATDGGTMFMPAYQMILRIAQEEFPSSTWNRYLFQATDGDVYDADDILRSYVTKIIKAFNFMGYLEIDPNDAHNGKWGNCGQALQRLSPEIKKHLGMSRVQDLKGLPDAFKQILTKDKKGR